MLGQPISMVLPQVVGYRLCGLPDSFITSTDIVLTVTKVTVAPLWGVGRGGAPPGLTPCPRLRSQHLRQVGVVGKLVEFLGPGVAQLSIADRATIANMCPEYGATAAFFPVDAVSLRYLEQTGEAPFSTAFRDRPNCSVCLCPQDGSPRCWRPSGTT